MNSGGRRQEVLLLDGGFSNELNKHVSFDVNKEPLWTAKALHTDGKAIFNTHMAYLEAGADIIETSTYQATVEGYKKHLDLDLHKTERLIREAAIHGHQAVDAFLEKTVSATRRKHPLVAGSVGPYGAFLCDGSEYNGNYIDTVNESVLLKLHKPRIQNLFLGGVDLFAVETIPSLTEAKVIMDIFKQSFSTANVWVSFSLRLNENKDPLQTAYGESMRTAFESLSQYPQLMGFGLNCCAPTDISPFLKEIGPIRDAHSVRRTQEAGIPKRIKLIVYPNSGQTWTPGTGWVNEYVPTLDTYVKEWMELGADIIGGCCQIGPNEIAKIRPVIDDWNSKRTMTN